MSERAQKIDLTGAAWFKLTLPGIVVALAMVGAGVRYVDKIDAQEKRMDAVETTQEKTTENLARVSEALAKVEGRLERHP